MEGLPEFDGEDAGWARVTIDDRGLDDHLHIHRRPITGSLFYECGKVIGVGEEFSCRFSSCVTNSCGYNDGLAGGRIVNARHESIVVRKLLIRHAPRNRPASVRGTATVNDGTNSILVEEAKAHVLSDTHGPKIIEGSNENRRPFAKLKEAGLRRNGDAKRLAPRFEFTSHVGEGDNIG